jgi:DNA-binding transcriptional ArsR family regulator
MNTAILDNTFAALADPTRRAILARLAGGAVTVNELAEPFDISLPAISRHLNVLERAALIVREREGQFRRCRLNPDALKAASEWLDFHTRFWGESFDRLAQHLKNPPEKPIKPRRGHGRRNRTRR